MTCWCTNLKAGRDLEHRVRIRKSLETLLVEVCVASRRNKSELLNSARTYRHELGALSVATRCYKRSCTAKMAEVQREREKAIRFGFFQCAHQSYHQHTTAFKPERNTRLFLPHRALAISSERNQTPYR